MAPPADARPHRDDLAAIADEIRQRTAELRAILPPGHHGLIWAPQATSRGSGWPSDPPWSRGAPA